MNARWGRIERLARARGYPDGEHAAADVLGLDIEDVAEHDPSRAETKAVIRALRDSDDEEAGMSSGAGDPGSPDRKWAMGGAGLIGAGWMVAPFTAATWFVTVVCGLICAITVAQWAEDLPIVRSVAYRRRRR